MIKYFYIILVFILFTACEWRLAKSDSSNYLHYYTEKHECGEHVFVLNDKYKSVLKWHKEHLEVLGDGESIYNTIAKRTYFKQPLYLSKKAFDTIQIANSMTEIRSGQIGWLYNLEIADQNWSVSLYYPYENVKGTYVFEITDSENQLIMSVLDSIISKFHNNEYFPEKDTIKFSDEAASAIYVKVIIGGVHYEYFSSLNSPPCDFSLLNQLVIVIIENHVHHKNMKSNKIEHLNIRNRFNHFMLYDKFTGTYVEDFDDALRQLQPPE